MSKKTLYVYSQYAHKFQVWCQDGYINPCDADVAQHFDDPQRIRGLELRRNQVVFLDLPTDFTKLLNLTRCVENCFRVPEDDTKPQTYWRVSQGDRNISFSAFDWENCSDCVLRWSIQEGRLPVTLEVVPLEGRIVNDPPVEAINGI